MNDETQGDKLQEKARATMDTLKKAAQQSTEKAPTQVQAVTERITTAVRERLPDTAAGGPNATIDSVTLVLMFGAIIGSIILWFQKKPQAAIFVGVWPPTFVALGALLKQTFGTPATP